MTLPPRKPKVRSGIERAPQRQYPRHEKYVRSFCCCVKGCSNTNIQFAHIRLGAVDNGIGIKPFSAHGISLCDEHHTESHAIGENTFAAKYGLILQKQAKEFALTSPVPEVREYARTYMRDV